MLSVVPEFYTRFSCRAGECRHSCCRGWEIDVDDESAAYYQSLPGPLGDTLRQALFEDEEGWHFRLDGEERCPLLRRDGLCRLILEQGEEALCDICALHPRFFLDCGELELCGLGLSCEAAAALLTEAKGSLRYVADGKPLFLPELLGLLGVPAAEESLRFSPCLDRARYAALLRALRDTEPIDGRWPEEIDALLSSLDRLLSPARDYARRCDPVRYENILGYVLYRQLDRLERAGFARLLDYARGCADYVFLLDAREEDTAEHLRRWSEQIEYSTGNVDLLLYR